MYMCEVLGKDRISIFPEGIKQILSIKLIKVWERSYIRNYENSDSKKSEKINTILWLSMFF